MSWIALGVGASRMARRRTSTFTHSTMRPSCSEGLSTRFVPSTRTSSPVSRSRVHPSGTSPERAAVLNIGLLREISRDERRPGAAERQDDEYGRLHASGIHVTGRIVINLWRTLRGELKLQSYTLESCAHAVLRRRLPCFPAKTLARWARGGDSAIGPSVGIAHQRWRAIRHATSRSNITARMMEQPRPGRAHRRAGSNLRHRLLLGAVQGQSVQGRVHVAATRAHPKLRHDQP